MWSPKFICGEKMINITSIASSYRLDYVGWEFRFGAVVLHLTYSMDYMEWAFKFGALPLAPLVTAFECIQIHRQIKSHKLGKLILQNFVYEFKTWIPRRWKIKDSGLFQYICSLKCDLSSQFPLYMTLWQDLIISQTFFAQ